MHAFQGRTVDTVIAAMEANYPNLTTQKTLYVEISRARDRAELVTDDRKALRESLEAVTGERIAALEAIERENPGWEKGRGAAPGTVKEESKSVGLEGGSTRSKDHEHEKTRKPRSLDRGMEL